MEAGKPKSIGMTKELYIQFMACLDAMEGRFKSAGGMVISKGGAFQQLAEEFGIEEQSWSSLYTQAMEAVERIQGFRKQVRKAKRDRLGRARWRT